MNITFIGAGNLATRLAIRLVEQGHNISQIFSRTEQSAKELAEKVDSIWITDPNALSCDVDLILIAIADNAFEEVLSRFQFNNCLIAHTAGSMPMDTLAEYSNNIGVFYPLQTFSKQRSVDFSKIPLCLEADSPENLALLEELAHSITNTVEFVSSEQRKHIHLSAVWVCNFVNHMYATGEELLGNVNLPFNILHPIMSETAQKAMEFSPKDVQTGPAVRFDKNVMNKHVDMLSNDDKKELYWKLSESIFNKHDKN